MYVPRASDDAAQPVGERTSNSRIEAASEPASRCERCPPNQPRDPRHRQEVSISPELQPGELSPATTFQRPLAFTPDMLKDQELLVSSLAQQGISESLIRRQFDKLLEEQSKQLSLDRESEQRPAAKPTGDPRESPAPSDATARRRSEPSSLLRLRATRETLEHRGRNNGLQDAATAAKIVDGCKSRSDRASSRWRLNGAQDAGAAEAEAFCRAHCLRRAASGRSGCPSVSANGLENSREKQVAPGVSRQEQQCRRPAGDAQREPVVARGGEQRRPRHDDRSSHPEIQEPRVFGGFTYFARKPQLGCTPQFAQPHPQPTNVNATRSTTAF